MTTAKICVRFGFILYGDKSPEGEYKYSLYNEMEEKEEGEISYNQALELMIAGTDNTEEDMKEYLLF